MIRSLERQHLNVEKYDFCVANSNQSRIFGFSWYLDIAVSDWSVLVYKDYEAVMPVPSRKKFGISYVYPPFWILELGIFSISEVDEQIFMDFLSKNYSWVELRMNSENNFIQNEGLLKEMQFQQLDIFQPIANIRQKYRKDRQKDLRKAREAGLKVKWDDSASVLIQLFKNTIGQRTPTIKTNDYQNLKSIIEACCKRNMGRILSVYAHDDSLVASAFVLLYQKKCTILISATDFQNRNTGANTFLIDTLISEYQKDYETFNFGGSSLPSVASYFKSFGAETISYPLVQKKGWLSLFVRLAKKISVK